MLQISDGAGRIGAAGRLPPACEVGHPFAMNLRTTASTILLSLIALSDPAVAQTASAPSRAIRFDAGAIPWKPAPPSLPSGSAVAVMEGDPQSDGIFTMRVRVPAGAHLAPHWHPRDERVTVISGAVELGFGTTPDRATVTRLGAGSFYVNPPREMHYLFFPEETVLQMTGIGPWKMEMSNVSAPAAPATATLRIVDIQPAAHAKLGPSDSVTVTVDYDIDGFRPDTFMLSLQFDTGTAGRTIGGLTAVVSRDGKPPAPPLPQTLPSAKGRAQVTAELRYLWTTAEVRHPLRARVFLQEMRTPSSSRVVASTETFEFAE